MFLVVFISARRVLACEGHSSKSSLYQDKVVQYRDNAKINIRMTKSQEVVFIHTVHSWLGAVSCVTF